MLSSKIKEILLLVEVNMQKTLELAIEEEKDNDEVEHIQHPSLGFAINDINIKTEQQTGYFLLDMLKHNEINLETPFQRSADLWKPDLMSRFIESMMLKFPIPPFYFNIAYKHNDTRQPFWEVIDGLQRLSAIKRFFFGDKDGKLLALRGLDFFPELNGKTVDELPRHLTRNIESCQVTLFEVYPNTPKVVKYRIFERVNTGGLKLNDQEIRHALNQGRSVEVLSDAVFEGLERNKILVDPGRMKDHELALRHIAFKLMPLEEFGESMKEFLDRAMEALGNLSAHQEYVLVSEFGESVRFVQALLGKIAFRREAGRPINKALFDSYTCAATQLTNHEKQIALGRADFARTLYKKSFEHEEYAKSISYATARIENVRKRFDTARSILARVIHD